LENSNLNESFSSVIFFWLYFNLILGVPLCIGFDYLKIDVSQHELLFLKLLFLSWIPIISIPVILPSLPYNKIDFTFKGLLVSFIHKIFFLFTLPVLGLGLIIGDYLGNENPFIKLITTWTIGLHIWGFTMTIIWIYSTLFLWEIVFGKNSSQTLKIRRFVINKNKDYINRFLKIQQIPNKVILNVIGLPLIFAMASSILGVYFGFFIKYVFLFFSFDLLVLLTSIILSLSYLNRNSILLHLGNNKYLGFNDSFEKKLGYVLGILITSAIIFIPVYPYISWNFYFNFGFICLFLGNFFIS
jgi:hypothetical protein